MSIALRRRTVLAAVATAVQGLARLVQLARDYGAPTDRLPGSMAETATYQQGAAMTLDYYLSPVCKGWRWVRFPRMPVRPIIPTQLRGWALGYTSGDGKIVTAPASDAGAEDGAVQFALWTCGQQRKNPGALLAPPVVADASAQSAYWRAQSGAAPLTNATDMWVVGAGWPALTLQFVDPVLLALSQAMAGGDLPSLLQTAAAKLNHQIDANAARASAQAAQQAIRASAEAAFPVAGATTGASTCNA